MEDKIALGLISAGVCLVVFFVVHPLQVKLPSQLSQCFPRSFPKSFPLSFVTVPLLGCLVLLFLEVIQLEHFVDGIVGREPLYPYAVLILFNAMAYLCLSLDATGIFAYIALWTTTRYGGSGWKLFLAVFALSSALTLVTSNDIVILTLTPIVCYACKFSKVNPEPFLFAEFIPANIWSSALYVGNPTNVIIADAIDLNPLRFSYWLCFPAVVAGFTSLAVIYLKFHSSLPTQLTVLDQDITGVLRDPAGAIFGAIWLALCLICILLSSNVHVDVPVWAITLFFATTKFFIDILRDATTPELRRRQSSVSESIAQMSDQLLHGNEPSDKEKTDENDGEEAQCASKPDAIELETIPLEQGIMDIEMQAQPSIDPHPADSMWVNWQALSKYGVSMMAAAKTQEVTGNMQNQPLVSHPSHPSSTCQNESEPCTSLPAAAPPAAQSSPCCLTRYLKRHFPTVFDIVSHMPWEIIPFVTGMFILVEGVSSRGGVSAMAWVLSRAVRSGPLAWSAVFMCTLSTVLCNVVNNQPLSILMAAIVRDPDFDVSDTMRDTSAYALILGANFGANLTLVGALAGLMWRSILSGKGQTMSYLHFLRTGIVIMPPVVLAASLALSLQMYILAD
eukprot:TRINITY_DN4913_c0_g1::TRINITY_DN4913_c0_g1_i1::g.16694::m.16694 TRINITY_DN4913_c0_g1::TRINITY_DN4913_c0_g1_i1::g.16694  ORF type:complete len:620 (-),score=122.46,sp/P96678/YDFA_BACSU/28.89/2e-15,sp/P96678/YDFA_BACSU/27.69/2e-06,ArsB/PF02040.10/7.8e-13,ArsB/PF02040.10/1.2e-20,CitMHS/PF03600.11/9.2e-22,CitMHS/PF03600.11/0.00015,CitMHS/PF03600.11/2.1e+02,DUF2953/PF11167.3/0.23 TRINITY_DN4913_c0_g1_i1:467-2326(-)